MAITGTPTTAGDDTVTVVAPGIHDYIDAGTGTDKMIINWSALTNDIVWLGSWGTGHRFTDDFFNTVGFHNFESVTFQGGSGGDDLRTTNGNDELYGNAGDDNLYSGLGADVVDGGVGVDRWVVDYGSLLKSVVVVLPAASVTSAYTVTASGAQVKSIEALSMVTGANADIVDTTAYNLDDSVETRAGNDTVKLGGGFDYADGGDGTDLLVVNWSGSTQDIVYTNEESWRRQFQDGMEDPVASIEARYFERFDITGGAGHDDLRGGDANDRLIGNAGNDALRGGKGIDIIDGGAGVDRWTGDFTNISQKVTTNINVAANVNAVVKFGTLASGAVVKNVEALTLSTGAGADVITAKNGKFNDTVLSGAGDDTVSMFRGQDYADGQDGTDLLVMNWAAAGSVSVETQEWWRIIYNSATGDRLEARYFERFNLTGGTGNDDLRGGALKDNLQGGGGNDTLNSGAGADVVNGGAGLADLWVADQSANTNAVLFNAKTSQTTAQGLAAGLNVRGIESVDLRTGAGNDVVSTAGYALNDNVRGNGGDDTFNTGEGLDFVHGGDGTDKVVLDWSAATGRIIYTDEQWWVRVLQEQKGGGEPATRSLRAEYVESWDITGGSGFDDLRGGDGDDRLVGNAGNDKLYGRGGVDTIVGGEGVDLFLGNYSGAIDDLNLTLSAAGDGTVQGVGTTLSGIERIDLTTGAGNDFISTVALNRNDRIVTNAGDDTVNVGKGRYDYADGGYGGMDTLVADMSLATSGIRYVAEGATGSRFRDSSGSYKLDYANFEAYNFTGSAYNDKLSGWVNADVLIGGAGDDRLEGYHGDDLLTGGAGADQFFFGQVWSNGRDTITDIEAGDFLRLSGVTLAGTVSVGDGSTLGAGGVQIETNTVDGHAVTTVHVGIDSTAGADWHVDLQDVTLGAAAFQLSGSDIRVISGSTTTPTAGDDVFNGSSGNDLLDAGAGNDVLNGNAGDDTLLGGAGLDVLNGGPGKDTMTGGTEKDTFVFKSMNDGTRGASRDVITDFSTAQGDVIDVSAIDANPVLANDQAFKFVVNFNGSAGQVRFDTTEKLVQFDQNGDGVADLEIEMVGISSMTAANFVL